MQYTRTVHISNTQDSFVINSDYNSEDCTIYAVELLQSAIINNNYATNNFMLTKSPNWFSLRV